MSYLLKMYILLGDKISSATANPALKVFEKVGGKEFATEVKRVEFARRQLVMRMRAGELTGEEVLQKLSEAGGGEEGVEKLGRMFARHWAPILKELAEAATAYGKEE